MKISQVGAQLFTLRDFLKTPEDIASTLKKVREIGYEVVQVSGMGPIAEEELLKMLEGEGLVCAATHEKGVGIVDEPEKVVERLSKLKCKYTAYPFPHIALDSVAAVKELAAKLNHAGRVLKDAGQVLTYHNHNNEFVKLEGKTIWDILMDETDPEFLQAEPDTYWVHLGGVENTGLMKKLKGRVPLVHLKDFQTLPDRTPFFCEIGNGNLPFKDIIAAADEAGAEWYFVEQDRCPADPFDSLKISFDYIKANLVS